MSQDPQVEEFLQRVDWRSVSRTLSDLLMEDAFFMKDRQGHFVMQNRKACSYCQAKNEAETLGKRDADYWPGDRAALYVEGDQMVMRSGAAMVNQLAPAPEEAGSDNMIIYSKFPVRDLEGAVIGVAGIHRYTGEPQRRPSDLGPLYPAIRKIHDHYSLDLKISELARISGYSRSQFVRRFSKVLGESPKKYLLRVRVRNACRMLELSQATVSAIAQQCGFFDHSHFSHAFRKITGMSPTRYRSASRSS